MQALPAAASYSPASAAAVRWCRQDATLTVCKRFQRHAVLLPNSCAGGMRHRKCASASSGARYCCRPIVQVVRAGRPSSTGNGSSEQRTHTGVQDGSVHKPTPFLTLAQGWKYAWKTRYAWNRPQHRSAQAVCFNTHCPHALKNACAVLGPAQTGTMNPCTVPETFPTLKLKKVCMCCSYSRSTTNQQHTQPGMPCPVPSSHRTVFHPVHDGARHVQADQYSMGTTPRQRPST